MISCRVRAGFYLHKSPNSVYEPGTVLDLTEEEFSHFAHQLEILKEDPVDELNEKLSTCQEIRLTGLQEGR